MPEPISNEEADRLRQLVATCGTALVLAHKALRSSACGCERQNAQADIEKLMPQIGNY
jgi:hypothetical protein